MSMHCYNKWTLNDPIDEAPIDDIATALQYHNYREPAVFSTLTVGDYFIYNIGIFLRQNRNVKLTKKLIKSDIGDSEYTDATTEVVVRVLRKLKLFNKILPSNEWTQQDITAYSKIKIPLVRKPLPPLIANSIISENRDINAPSDLLAYVRERYANAMRDF